jgi:hypothetical protein
LPKEERHAKKSRELSAELQSSFVVKRRSSSFLLGKTNVVSPLTQSKAVESVNHKPVSRPGVSSLTYCEELDVLISGYEDGRLCELLFLSL